MWCWRAAWCLLRCLGRRQQASLPCLRILGSSQPAAYWRYLCSTAVFQNGTVILQGSNHNLPSAGGGNKALLDSGVFRALVMLLATGRFPNVPELR